MFSRSPEIKIIKDIDTSDKWWCDSAVLFSVKNGKNTICELAGREDDDYEYNLQMQMNGVPLVQGHFPCCPTCKGMLAAGYGSENVDSPEFEAARNCMNSAFISVWDSAYKAARSIVKKGDGFMRHRRVKASLLFLLNYRDEETEQIFVDFYLAHEEHDENWNIANSYWKDRKD